jgi:hypothetical protein
MQVLPSQLDIASGIRAELASATCSEWDCCVAETPLTRGSCRGLRRPAVASSFAPDKTAHHCRKHPRELVIYGGLRGLGCGLRHVLERGLRSSGSSPAWAWNWSRVSLCTAYMETVSAALIQGKEGSHQGVASGLDLVLFGKRWSGTTVMPSQSMRSAPLACHAIGSSGQSSAVAGQRRRWRPEDGRRIRLGRHGIPRQRLCRRISKPRFARALANICSTVWSAMATSLACVPPVHRHTRKGAFSNNGRLPSASEACDNRTRKREPNHAFAVGSLHLRR